MTAKGRGLFLLNRNIAYDISDQRYFAGDQERAVSCEGRFGRPLPLNLAIYTLKEERGILRTTPLADRSRRAGFMRSHNFSRTGAVKRGPSHVPGDQKPGNCAAV